MVSDLRIRAASVALAAGILGIVLACSGGGSVAQQVSGPLYQVSGKAPGAPAVQGNGYIDSTGTWVIPPPVTGPSVIGAAPVALRRDGACVHVRIDGGGMVETEVGKASGCLALGTDRVVLVERKSVAVVDAASGAQTTFRVSSSVPPMPALDGGPLGLCEQRDKCGFLGPDGEWLGAGVVYTALRPFSGGLGAAKDASGRWHLVDATGVTHGDFELLFGPADGMALALRDRKCGGDDPECQAPSYVHELVDAMGEVKAELGRRPLVEDDNPERLRPHDGVVLLPASKGDGAELVDVQGEVVRTLNRYPADGVRFSEGRAAVKGDAGWSYVDKKGKTVIEGPFSLGGPFEQGRAKVAGDQWVDGSGSVLKPKP